MGIGNDYIGSNTWIISMYREQLDKFKHIGIGNKTENGVVVTDKLIEMTRRRLGQLCLNYRKDILKADDVTNKLIKEKLGELKHTNGTAASFRGKSNRNTRHERGKS